MLKNRAIRKSLYNFVVSLFSTPPATTGWGAFNVYTETQLRQYRKDGSFTPVRPYIFIVDSYIAPNQTELPMIVVEVSHLARPFQLGDTRGRLSQANLHVFGSNRGERDDIASMLQDVFAKNMVTSGSVVPFPVYDFITSGSSVLIETAMIDDGVTVTPMKVGDIERHESSLANWNIVGFSFETKA